MKNLIILTGPTAVGKTSLSIKLAQAVNGEIISADCMQVYKHMDVGTAKVTKEEMLDIPHHMIDVIEPDEEFHVVKFKEMVLQCMDEIYAKGKVPIICGGTGFYIQAILYDIEFSDCDSNETLRDELEQFADENGNDALLARLREIDPEAASEIPANNRKRVIRAIEYFTQTGQKISEHNKEQRERLSPYNYAYFVLNDDREVLYNRINKRVDIMVKNGLEDEVKELLNMGYKKGMTSMDGIGYKEMLDYYDGNCTLSDAIETIKQNSRRYAKRQLTWFRREKDVVWLDKTVYDTEDKILNEITRVLNEKGIK